MRPISADLEEDDYRVRCSNEYYYMRSEGHLPTREACKKDRYCLPEDANPADQLYFGLYAGSECRAIVELLGPYPDEGVLQLAWLILDASYHRRGLGSWIMKIIFREAKMAGFDTIRLCCYDVNERGKAFWKKQGFTFLRESEKETDLGQMKLLVLERDI